MFDWLWGRRDDTTAVALATIAAQRACLIDTEDEMAFILNDCRHIDPGKATDEELEKAISSCQFYWGHAYPEYEDDLCSWIWGAASDELDRRRKSVGADW